MTTDPLLKAVLDTNIFLSALLTRSPTSPSAELLERWAKQEWLLLISETLAAELVEKLEAKRISLPKITTLLDLIAQRAIWVDVAAEDVPDVLLDPDDNHVVACAVVGQADYLVTYDRHFAPLGDEYQGVRIVRPLPFLWAVRGESRE